MRSLILSLIWVLGLSFCAKANPINPADSASLENSIHSKLDYIIKNGNTTDNLSEEDLANLPIGIKKEIGGKVYMIIIDSVKFTPYAAYFNAYASLEYSETGDRLAFAATNIKFQPGGLATSVSSKLKLVSPKKIAIGKEIDLIITPDGQNYIEFDCNGFKSINVKGLFEFSENILLPAEGKTEKVTATFEGNFTDLENIIASISISPFRPKKFQDITVEVKEATIDLSDIKNPVSVQFPKDYHSGAETDPFWKGFYLKAARITLPSKLNNKSKELHIDAQHLIIDKKGFSGNIGVADLFGKDDGSLNGWPFSIDSLGIHLVKNQLKGAVFKGVMVVPPFDKDTPVNYYALIDAKEDGKPTYQFTLEPTENIKASVLMADIELLPGSTITVAEKDGKFKPEAFLNGFLSVKSGNKVDVKKLKFESLSLASEKPFVRSGTWSLVGEGNPTAGKYPISIDKVELKHAADEMKLSLDIALNLMSSEDKGFSGRSTVEVYAALKEETIQQGEYTYYEQNWEYEKTTLSSISIKVKTTAFSLDGQLDFYENNQKFGNGFRGEINAQFTDFGVTAIGQFGNVNGFRYWYVDASVRFPSGIGNGFGIYGIGGGLSYHMAKKVTLSQSVNEFKTVTGSGDSKSIGQSRSSTIYEPDKTIGLGFKASVIVGTMTNPNPLNGVVTYEMDFFDKGGIRKIGFHGDAYFMKGLDDPAEKSSMYANLSIEYDFENSVLHGSLVTYVNVNDVVVGLYEKGRAGTAIIHVDKKDWYIHVGTPDNRIGLDFIGFAEANSYFMLGTYIHDFPSVTDVIPSTFIKGDMQDKLNSFMRDENSLATGGGIAFGTSLTMSLKRQHFLMFYAELDAGLGFDVMLRDYVEARCEGESEPIGINGWYAAGQAWVYVNGEIGISVKLKFIEGDFVIFQGGVAAVVQAKLPNPLFMQGNVVGHYNILGGLVKGNFDFEFTIGEDCTLTGGDNAIVNLKVIAELQPQDAEEVDVFAAPQVAFNVPVNQVMEWLDATENTKAYKVQLDHFKVKKGDQEIVGQLEWSEDYKTVIFNSFEILPPKSTLTAEVKVTWYVREKGEWTALGGSAPEYEEESISFTTGEAPTYIPESNVAYSYPSTGMYNFYPDEYAKGYLQLKKGQSYLFEENTDFDYEVRMIPVGKLEGPTSPLTYNSNERVVNYNLPSGLQNEKSHTIVFVKKPKNTLKVDENVSSVIEVVHDSETSTLEVEIQDIEGYAVLEEEELLYESIFRTSKFKTFEEKVNAITWNHGVKEIYTLKVLQPTLLTSKAPEIFDEYEVKGDVNVKPLVQFTAKLNNNWYNNKIYPLNYEYYPVSSKIKISWRDPATLGVPPHKGMFIVQDEFPLLSNSIIYSGEDLTVGGKLEFVLDMSFYAYRDFKDLQAKAFTVYGSISSSPPEGAYRLMSRAYSNISAGDYDFNVSYYLPGKDEATKTIPLKIIY